METPLYGSQRTVSLVNDREAGVRTRVIVSKQCLIADYKVEHRKQKPGHNGEILEWTIQLGRSRYPREG